MKMLSLNDLLDILQKQNYINAIKMVVGHKDND